MHGVRRPDAARWVKPGFVGDLPLPLLPPCSAASSSLPAAPPMHLLSLQHITTMCWWAPSPCGARSRWVDLPHTGEGRNALSVLGSRLSCWHAKEQHSSSARAVEYKLEDELELAVIALSIAARTVLHRRSAGFHVHRYLLIPARPGSVLPPYCPSSSPTLHHTPRTARSLCMCPPT